MLGRAVAAFGRVGWAQASTSIRHYAAPSQPPGVIVVFGAAGGIGSALAERIAQTHSNATLVLADLERQKLDAIAQKLSNSKKLETHAVDATKPDQVARLVSDIVAKHGRIDAVASLVGNVMMKPGSAAGTAQVSGKQQEAASTNRMNSSLEDLQQAVTVNLYTAFNVLQASAEAMVKTGGGSIVLTSAAVAETGVPNFEAMSAAKAGVEGLVRSTAATYARSGVRVNAVAPGLTKSPQTQSMTSNSRPANTSAKTHPVKHVAEPHDIAAAMAFLLAPGTDFITGQVLAVDGGLSTLTMQQHE